MSLSARWLASVQSQTDKFKPFLSLSLQGLFCTQMLSGQFFNTKAIALSDYGTKHFYKTHLLRLTSSFSHT